MPDQYFGLSRLDCPLCPRALPGLVSHSFTLSATGPRYVVCGLNLPHTRLLTLRGLVPLHRCHRLKVTPTSSKPWSLLSSSVHLNLRGAEGSNDCQPCHLV